MMTESEIIRNYQQAKDKKKQIGILADLNLCDKATIEKIVGIHKEPAKKKSDKKPDLNEVIKNLYEEMEAVDKHIKELEERYTYLKAAIDAVSKLIV